MYVKNHMLTTYTEKQYAASGRRELIKLFIF